MGDTWKYLERTPSHSPSPCGPWKPVDPAWHYACPMQPQRWTRTPHPHASHDERWAMWEVTQRRQGSLEHSGPAQRMGRKSGLYSISTYFKIIEDISKVWIIFGLDGSEWGTNAILYATLTFKIIFPPQHDAKRSAKSSPLVRSSSTCKGSSSEKCGYKFLSSNGPSFQAHSCQMFSISKASWLM